MTKEMQDLVAKRASVMDSIDPANVDRAKLDEVKAIDNKIADLQEYENLQKGKAKEEPVKKPATKKDASYVAIANVLRGRVTDEDQQLIQRTGGAEGNGENYLIPEDVRLEINEMKKQWKSAKELCSVYAAMAVTGKFNFDVTPTAGLVGFDDGDAIDQQVAPTFVQKSYTITYKGAIIPVSGLLQGNERANLMGYLRNWFAKRAIIKENADIFAAMKTNYNSGTPKAIADWKALKKSINKDLDPAITESDDCVVITNQSGFDVLDSALDETGRPVLQPDPTNPTRRLFMGKRVEIFSNSQLPNNTTASPNKAPIIYGDTKRAFWFMENPSYEFATDNGTGIGFTKNQTYLRVIEGYAVMPANTSDYIYGELPLA